MRFTRFLAAALAVAALDVFAADAATPVVVRKTGADKISISVETSADGAGKDFNDILMRNLQRSGCFQLVAKNGAIRVTGSAGAAGANVVAAGRGKQLTNKSPYADVKSARMRARALSDAIVEAFANQKGFASNPIALVNRKGSDNAEICTCYPDGFDLRQSTSDKRAAVGPRWSGDDIYYIGFLKGKPLAYCFNTSTGVRKCLANFKGSVTGLCPSPDGRKVAIVLSHLGNPELFVLDLSSSSLKRLTNTKNGSEASPCWSPDGTKIAYVSDTTRHPQVYVVDIASGKSSRVSNSGTENTNPTWSNDGRLAWASKRAGGTCIVVTPPGGGEPVAVTKPGTWEHPAWSRDNRHLVAQMGGAVFIVDGAPKEEDRDAPVRIFNNAGNWMSPDWRK